MTAVPIPEKITTAIPASALDALITFCVEQAERSPNGRDASALLMAAVILRTARRTQRPVVIGM